MYTLNAEPGEIRLTGYPIGTVREGAPESSDGRRVDSRPASGGRALSNMDINGAYQAELTEPLDRGRPAEPHALKILVQALQSRGDEVALKSHGSDDRGEDGILSINGNDIPVQVVSLPVDKQMWRKLSKESSAVVLGSDQGEAVQLVRDALVHKKDKATQTILVLHAAHLGAIIGPRLVTSYLAEYGSPVEEFSLIEVWLVGPTVQSTIRLGGP